MVQNFQYMRRVVWTIVGLFVTVICVAQESLPTWASEYIVRNSYKYGFTKEDLEDLAVVTHYRDARSGIEHVYLQQRYKGVPIHNALWSLHRNRQGKVYASKPRFVKGIVDRVVEAPSRLTAREALLRAAQHIGMERPLWKGVIEKRQEGDRYVFEQVPFSRSPVHMHKVYVLNDDGNLVLCWDLAIDRVDKADYPSMRIDVSTGQVVDSANWMVHCRFGEGSYEIVQSHAESKGEAATSKVVESRMDGARYYVIPLPAESPLTGSFQWVIDPADPIASPNGWHRVRNQLYTITKGNNAHAYTEWEDDGQPDMEEPDGGPELHFNYMYDTTKPVDDSSNARAAVVNAFYVTNMFHDILYRLGFDEQSGNFQEDNFRKGGLGGDAVIVQSQDRGGQNNANFSTPPDGLSGRMQLYLWSNTASEVTLLLGQREQRVPSVQANFGKRPPFDPIVAPMEIVDDGTEKSSRGCRSPLKNDLTGKVAIIDRGTCEFGTKCLNAQNAGAVAALICGFDDSRVVMAPGQDGDKVTIPAYYIPRTACERIRIYAGDTTVKIRIGKENAEEIIRATSFDNGVIIHEYGHGVSNRLTGGPLNSDCLSNVEQMGEGWSDFFSLALTHQPGMTGEQPRGLGNYVTNLRPSGRGIRPKPYSTDMKINDFTYFSARALSIPHGLGSVWATMLWEMYWQLVDAYGFDPEIRDTNAGNFIALRLVVEGMRLQPCKPGFVDGRDAILLADTLLYNAAHSCLIWKAFAKRGLGYGASQGDPDEIGDEGERESFLPPPVCQNRFLLQKHVTPEVVAGEDVTVQLVLSNNRPDTAFEVVITDTIPQYGSYVQGSASIPPDSVDGNVLYWRMDTMIPLQSVELTYRFTTDPNRASKIHWYERVEEDLDIFEDTWQDVALNGYDYWDVTEEYVRSKPYAFYIQNSMQANDQHLFLRNPLEINLSNPVLRFHHWYRFPNIRGNVTAGTVEYSVDGGPFLLADSLFIRNGFSGPIPYGTFVEPFYKGFYGSSDSFVRSYLDLKPFIGRKFNIKFRYGHDSYSQDFVLGAPDGWAIDDIELIDLVEYTAQACVEARGIERTCVYPAEGSTFVEATDTLSGVRDITGESIFQVYPNPARRHLHVRLTKPSDGPAVAELLDDKGRTIRTVKGIGPVMRIDVSTLPAGWYVLRMRTRTAYRSIPFIVLR